MEATSTNTRFEGRSLVGLVSDLWRETSTLIRSEAELATAEISEKVSRAETGIASLAVGGAILFAGFLVLLAAAVGGLAQVLPPDYAAWLAPLIVGVVVAVIGWILLAQGRGKLKANDLKLSRTGRSLRRDTELAKAHITGEHAK